MAQWRFTIVGEPKTANRRLSVRSGRIFGYNPKDRQEWLDHCRDVAWHDGDPPPEPLQGPIALLLTFHRRRPKSQPKSRPWPTQNPDLDNYAKPVIDALTGLFWRDDAQVCELVLRKRFGEPERVDVEIVSLEGRLPDENLTEELAPVLGGLFEAATIMATQGA